MYEEIHPLNCIIGFLKKNRCLYSKQLQLYDVKCNQVQASELYEDRGVAMWKYLDKQKTPSFVAMIQSSISGYSPLEVQNN